jgi:hypothetical protein
MLFTTLRQLVSISGRTILAIGLTSATVLALAPSAKAEPDGQISVENQGVSQASFVPSGIQFKGDTAATAYTAASTIGSLVVQNNTTALGYDIKVSSANIGLLKATVNSVEYTAAYKLSIATADNATTAGLVSPPETGTGTATIATIAPAVFDPQTLSVLITNDGANFKALPQATYTDTVIFTLVNKTE